MKFNFYIYACLLLSFMCAATSMILAIASFRISHKKSAKNAAFCDLLDYATLGPNDIIVLKTGSFLKCYEITPFDRHQMSEDKQQHLRKLLAKALRGCNGEWTFHLDMVRRNNQSYLNGNYFGPANGKKLDSLRAKQFSFGFETSLYLSLTFSGQGKTKRLIERLFSDGQSLNYQEKTLKVFDDFQKQLSKLLSSLSLALTLKPLSLSQDGFHDGLSFIKECITGEKLPLRMPKYKAYLDAILSSRDFTTYPEMKIGNKFISCVAIDGLPSQSLFCMLENLTKFNFAYRFSTRFICYSNLSSHLKLEHYRRLWSQKRYGILSQIFNTEGRELNEDAQKQLNRIKKAKNRLDYFEQSFGAYTAVIILMHEDPEILKAQSASVSKAIESNGFGSRIESVNAAEAYLGSLPGHCFENLRRNLISNEVLTDLLPLSIPYLGDKYSPNPFFAPQTPALLQAKTQGNQSFYLNLHDQDLANTIVLGPPGTGKSVLLGHLIVSLLRYENMKVYAFDKGMSFYALTKALAGDFLNLSTDDFTLCPLEHLENKDDFIYAGSFIKTLLDFQGKSITSEENSQLNEALRLLSVNSRDKRSLTDFSYLLANRELNLTLSSYLSSKKSSRLDGICNPEYSKQLTVFECAEIFDSPKNELYPLLTQIFHLISRQIKGRHPCAIVLDEAWLMLKDEIFSKELVKWFKTLRKYNAFVIMATQSVADLFHSEIFMDLIDCAKSRIYLPNADALSSHSRSFYEQLGLGLHQIKAIANGIGKRDLFLQKGGFFSKFNLCLSPNELWLLSNSGPKSAAYIDLMFKQYGNDFLWHIDDSSCKDKIS